MKQTDQQNVPKLRFPGFKEDWKITRIGDIGTFFYGKSAPKFSLVEEGGIPCVRYGELYRIYGSEISEVVSQTSVPRKNLRFSKGGEILVPRVGEDPMDFAAHSSFLPLKDIAIGEMISAFRTKEDPIFFTHYFRTLRKPFARVVEGANVSNLYYSYLEDVRIGRPTLPEQRKIAHFLAAVDKKIAQLAEKKRLLEDYKKGCIQQLFSQKIRFKNENGQDFPDWEEKRLRELFERVRQKNKIGNKNVLTISAQAGLVNQLDYFNHSVAAKDTSGYYLLKKGDFAYNKSYSKGYPMGAIKRLKYYDQGIVSTLYICFRAKNPEVEQFYECYFDSGLQNHWLAQITQEGARNHGLLNMAIEDVFDMPLPYPHPEEQRKIADFLSAIDRKIDLIGKELEQAKTFKKGLLQQMFV